jgi:hypothetical protein
MAAKRTDGPTPAGGAYSVAVYLDEHGRAGREGRGDAGGSHRIRRRRRPSGGDVGPLLARRKAREPARLVAAT